MSAAGGGKERVEVPDACAQKVLGEEGEGPERQEPRAQGGWPVEAAPVMRISRFILQAAGRSSSTLRQSAGWEMLHCHLTPLSRANRYLMGAFPFFLVLK